MEIKANIIKKLSDVFQPIELEVEDQSYLHANHNENAKKGGTHFKVLFVQKNLQILDQLIGIGWPWKL